MQEDSHEFTSMAQKIALDISLRKLRVFSTVANYGSITKAAKVLNLTQPTVSQQISYLESSVGSRLFERLNGKIYLTEFGIAFLSNVERILEAANDLGITIISQGRGKSRSIKMAGLPSVLKCLLPSALENLLENKVAVDVDVKEGSPGDIIDLLICRQINLALLSSDSVDDLPQGFVKVPIVRDPYVLVSPLRLDLSDISDPQSQLSCENFEILHRNIQFSNGNQYSKKLNNWFSRIFHNSHVLMRARNFELGAELVRSGIGICVLPAMSLGGNKEKLSNIRAYSVNIPEREIVAVLPKHYMHQHPYSDVVNALVTAAARWEIPVLNPQPPFISALAARI